MYIIPLINTPNIYLANQNKVILQYCDFNVALLAFCKRYKFPKSIFLYPDSFAIYLLLKYFYSIKLKLNVSTDLQDASLQIADKNRNTIYLFGGSEQTLQQAIFNIKLRYHNLIIQGYHSGFDYDESKVIEIINNSHVDILYVGLGLTRQEPFLIRNYDKLNPNLIISVGGWFEYLAGNIQRAPRLMRDYHLEWLFKLTIEFRRVWRRYLLDLPIFICLVLTKKIIFKISDAP